jgi:CBS domain-containing protein
MMQVAGTIRDLLRSKGHEAWSLSPTALVYDAIVMMADKHVGALLVISERRLVGIVSERDYARKVILQGRSSKETQVHEIMTTPVIVVTPRHTVDESMRIMTTKRIRHLPVTEDKNVVGIVSIGDLVNWITSAQEDTIRQLEGYITGSYSG